MTLTVNGNDEFGQARPDVVLATGATDIKAFPMTAFTRAVDPATGLLTVLHSGALTGVTSAYITI